MELSERLAPLEDAFRQLAERLAALSRDADAADPGGVGGRWRGRWRLTDFGECQEASIYHQTQAIE